ncbi:MAG: glycosyltransferase family 39 protein [Desulfobacterales bacterium]|nr:glycosyltransferase family 39 protein [Desulfobacterales bacterium]
MNEKITEKNFFLLCLGISVILRTFIFFLIYPDITLLMSSDQMTYLSLSDKILNGLVFDITLDSNRTPVYPLFLALLRSIYDNLFFVLIIQNGIGISCLWLSYTTGLLFSKRIAMFSCLFTSANLNMAIHSNLILTESIFYPIFYLFIFVLFTYSRNKSNYNVIFLGIILGISTLTRPIIMFLPLLIAGYITLCRHTSFKQKTAHIVLFCIMYLGVIAPWMYRNYKLYGHIGLSSQGAVMLVSCIIPTVLQYEKNIDLITAREEAAKLWLKTNTTDNPFEYDKEHKKIGVTYLMNTSFMSIAKAYFWGAVKFIFSPVTNELAIILKLDCTSFSNSHGTSVPEQVLNYIFNNKSSTYKMLLIGGTMIIFVFRLIQLYGFLYLYKLDKSIFILSLMIIFYFTVISIPVSYSRYRIPFEIILSLLTAIGVIGRRTIPIHGMSSFCQITSKS